MPQDNKKSDRQMNDNIDDRRRVQRPLTAAFLGDQPEHIDLRNIAKGRQLSVGPIRNNVFCD